MSLFYDSTVTANTTVLQFEKEESKHLAKVLRKKEGDSVQFTNGVGGEWKGRIIELSPNKSKAEKVDFTQHDQPLHRIHLAIAPTKNNNRMEWLIEKLTELGVASITPLRCAHSERKEIKRERFEKIAIAALKQSQQFFLPLIHPMDSFDEFLTKCSLPLFIAHCQAGNKSSLFQQALVHNQVTVLIGPEGDFSPKEIEVALSKGALSVSLGTQRFRTETAGFVACHTAFLAHQQMTHF